MSVIEKTKQYLFDAFENSQYLSENPKEKGYRYDHTLRVSAWGKQIAELENLDVDAVVVGCLLHDLSYLEPMPTREDQLNHGRRSCELVRDFVEGLGFDKDTTQDILYGIAIHVDGKAGFEWRSSILADTIGDADNIDRFDIYRIYETLEYEKFSELSNDAKREFCEKRRERIQGNLQVSFATPSATQFFHDRLRVMDDFYSKMLLQLSRTI